MKDHKEIFDRRMQMLHATVYHEPETPEFHNKLIDQLNETLLKDLGISMDSKIVDIGCGSGYWMGQMLNRGYTDVTGITLDDTDIDNCKAKGLTAYKQDFTFTDYEDNSVDFLFCRQALEHSPMPIMTLLEFNRIMKMGAKGYIEVPAPGSDRKHEQNLNHFSIMGMEMWKQLLLRSGLNISWSTEYEFGMTDQIANDIFVEQKDKFYMFTVVKTVELK